MSLTVSFIIKEVIIRMFIKRIARRVLESKALKGKLTLTATLPLIIGALAGAFGYDLAPTQVDVIVTFVSSLGVTIGYARAVYQAFKEGRTDGVDEMYRDVV